MHVQITDHTSHPQLIVAKEVIYNPAIVAIKTSILLLYRRIFTERCFNSSFNMTLWCTGAFILSYSSCQALLTVFYCTPVEALWDHRIEAKCINFDQALIILSSLNIVTDILIICLPVTQLWKLFMPKRQRCQLIGIFLLGGLFVSPSILLALSSSYAACASPASSASLSLHTYHSSTRPGPTLMDSSGLWLS